MAIGKGKRRAIRPRSGARRMEMSALRVALQDGRYWSGLGLVVKPSGETKHYEIDDDIGVLVHVELMPNGEPLMCRLGGIGEGGGNGIWRIPPVGSEVALLVPGGAVDGEVLLVGVLASGGVPAELDDDTLVVKGPQKIMVIGAEVLLQSEGGSPEPLITKSQFDAHVHPTGVGPSGVPNNASTSGTTVVKGE